MTPLEIVPARPGQGPLVARWIARSLDPSLLPLTIWRSPRAGRYVESLWNDTPQFYLLRREGLVAGLAAFRRLDGCAFLNHLAIGARWRGRGLGRRLLAESAAAFLKTHPARWVALDAFAGRPATAWYRRLGFVIQEQRDWYTRTSPSPLGRRLTVVGVQGLAEADRRHRAWGFSTFTAGPYTVGRLYTPYFRFTDPGAARDRDLVGLLAALDPARRLLLVASGAPPPWTRVARSDRLVCSADLLLERLSCSKLCT